MSRGEIKGNEKDSMCSEVAEAAQSFTLTALRRRSASAALLLLDLSNRDLQYNKKNPKYIILSAVYHKKNLYNFFLFVTFSFFLSCFVRADCVCAPPLCQTRTRSRCFFFPSDASSECLGGGAAAAAGGGRGGGGGEEGGDTRLLSLSVSAIHPSEPVRRSGMTV